MGSTVRERRVISSEKPVTFDAGALIAIERGDSEIRALVRVLAMTNTPIRIPAPVIAEVWRGGSGAQARLAHFLGSGLDKGHVEIVALDYAVAKEVGVILNRASMSVTDGTVCQSAVLTGGGVVTSDPKDIQQIIPVSRIKVV